MPMRLLTSYEKLLLLCPSLANEYKARELDMASDKITKVTLSDGIQIQVNMPTMGDIEDTLNGINPSETFAYVLASKAAGMSLNEFRKLSLGDGIMILNVVMPAMDAMTAYLQGSTQGKT